MKIREVVFEGGWASAKTQGTVITPQVLAQVVRHLTTVVEPKLNQWLSSQNIPEIKFGRPVGSGSYYERHLATQPNKTYGDIDIQFVLPRLDSMSTSANRTFYYDLVKKFGDQTNMFSSENGKNIIVEIGADQYVQVDLVSLFGHLVSWSTIFTPPEGVKGVLSASLYSALAEALNLSISDLGVQVKMQNGQIVPYSRQKDVTIVEITTNPKQWALDIAKYFGSKQIDPVLQRYPGMADEITLEQITGSIVGLARTLELNNLTAVFGAADAESLLEKIKQIYIGKIEKVASSSKFEKAATPEAQKLARDTQELLRKKAQAIAQLLTSQLSEGVKSRLATAGLAAGLALGGGYLAKNPNMLPDWARSSITTPPTTARYIEPLISFLQQLEPNNLRDLLANVAVAAGLKGDELAQFMAQTHHESANFKKMEEIGSERSIARRYDIKYNPDQARRLGNIRPGDGWRFRGRGFIQLTGRANYRAASKALFGDERLLENPDIASQPAVAAKIALWYWGWRVQPRVNNFDNTAEVTKPINPGLRGLDDRKRLYDYYSTGSNPDEEE